MEGAFIEIIDPFITRLDFRKTEARELIEMPGPERVHSISSAGCDDTRHADDRAVPLVERVVLETEIGEELDISLHTFHSPHIHGLEFPFSRTFALNAVIGEDHAHSEQ